MAAPARYQRMQIMSNLFVMVGEVALAAVPVNVFAVASFRGLGMTDHTGHFRVRRLGIFCRVHKGNFFPCEDLARRSELSVTMEAGRRDLFNCLARFRPNTPVTGHARLILRRKRREFFPFLMAGAALLIPRLGGIEGDLFFDRSLIMRVVAGQTHLVFFNILDFVRTVPALHQITRDLFMADQAVVRLKKDLGAFPYFFWIGMKRFLLNVVMAVPAGCLTVDRGVEFLGVDPPGGMGRDGTPQ